MSDIMFPVPFKDLLYSMVAEYSLESSIFGIHESQIFRKKNTKSLRYCNDGGSYNTPAGPAAGPHTQLTQNILTSYLAGGRFIELKTVQIMDTLEIEKPCIDAGDEGYNVEWSTEFTLTGAYDEYVKAWILLHVLETLLPSGYSGNSDYNFIFNMSVGYDLKGIKTDRMQQFINTMINASEDDLFNTYLHELDKIAEEGTLFSGTVFKGREKELGTLRSVIAPAISPSVTLSTMHGCPPDEIEAICSYMITEKNIHTYVKLNPTLLGYKKVRELLDTLGFDYIELKEESFDHDLQYPDAAAMLKRLVKLAEEHGVTFGIKLTNTLGTANIDDKLPGGEKYMSGRALFPISIALAAKISAEFNGELPISYSGGASIYNIRALFETGIRPITVATDLLKPGGYSRLATMAEACETSEAWSVGKVNPKLVAELAQKAAADRRYHKEYRGDQRISVSGKLPKQDCYIAPCITACPIHQDIPEYIHLTGQGRYADALELIYDKNPLPNMTGHICDHQCMYNCTRRDYEGAVDIRTVKRIAVDHGFAEYRAKKWEQPMLAPVKAAVIGAGPAGLSAAYFLARSGFTVTVFEREKSAGGVVNHIIPKFRLPSRAIEADIEFVKDQGVDFRFGISAEEIGADTLMHEGFSYVLYAIGAEKDNPIPLKGSRDRVIPALDFLKTFRSESGRLDIGRQIVIAGGGNTAMDSARAAVRVPGVEQVSVLYRRTKREMPADLEEYDNAVEEGVQFRFLATPEEFAEGGRLLCRKMTLGEPDDSGRRRPVVTDETFILSADTLITAIGEKVDSDAVHACGIPLNERGWAETDENGATVKDGVYIIGDAQSGPSTIVQCIAGARAAVESILDKELGPEEDEIHDHDHDHDHGPEHEHGPDCNHGADSDIQEEEDHITSEDLNTAELAFFSEIRAKKVHGVDPLSDTSEDIAIAQNEAARCLECSYICNKCVEVCPNRANVAIDVRNLNVFDDPYQIVHLDDYCNECGNCATFCPWNGKPYTDKLTIFRSKEQIMNSKNSGIAVEKDRIHVRLDSEVISFADPEDMQIEDENTAVLIDLILEKYSYLL